MDNKEYRLKVEDFEQLLGVLSTFDTTLEQSCCQATIGLNETTMFNKMTSGKSDLFTSSIHLDVQENDSQIDGLTMFIPNVKKFILVLKNIGKYYDIKDISLFNEGKIKLFVCSRASYVRIASPKYNIKFQLSTSAIMESQIGKVEKVLTPSKYGSVVHSIANKEDLQANFLLTANVNTSKFSEINDLLTTLAENTESSIKIQIPEQASIEEDVNSRPWATTLYATISDSQEPVKPNRGNKVSVDLGKITYEAENYKDICNIASTRENFVFLCSKNTLDILSNACRAFTSASKAKDMEVVISKPNLIHINMTVQSQTSKSEVYLTLIGTKIQAMF